MNSVAQDPDPVKPKYYPHVTICGAVLLTAAPLLIVVLLSNRQDDFPLEDFPLAGESNNVMVDSRLATATRSLTVDGSASTAPDEDHTAPQTGAVAQSGADRRMSDPQSNGMAEAPPRDDRNNRLGRARVALHSPSMRDGTLPTYGGPVLPITRPAADNKSNGISDAAAVSQMADVDPSDVVHEAAVPPPSSMAGSASSAASPPTQQHRPQETYDSLDERSSAEIVPSPFEATGHLAMAGGPAAAIGETPNRPSVAPSTLTTKMTSEMISSIKDKSDLSKSVGSAKGFGKSRSGRVRETYDPADAARLAAPFATEPVAQIEDVVLQHPLENRRVARVENLVAVTRAPGWPVTLVRSDLPDDHWWVQQMVGIRGNAFAARVNFGNENSIGGSIYHLVIVFLDSPDEVRRFRIAKQFKKLPEGVRRSREFTFTRR